MAALKARPGGFFWGASQRTVGSLHAGRNLLSSALELTSDGGLFGAGAQIVDEFNRRVARLHRRSCIKTFLLS